MSVDRRVRVLPVQGVIAMESSLPRNVYKAFSGSRRSMAKHCDSINGRVLRSCIVA